MKRLLTFAVVVLLVAAGCRPGETVETSGLSGINYVHDAEPGVGCWIINGHGISCLADSEYKAP